VAALYLIVETFFAGLAPRGVFVSLGALDAGLAVRGPCLSHCAHRAGLAIIGAAMSATLDRDTTNRYLSQ